MNCPMISEVVEPADTCKKPCFQGDVLKFSDGEACVPVIDHHLTSQHTGVGNLADMPGTGAFCSAVDSLVSFKIARTQKFGEDLLTRTSPTVRCSQFILLVERGASSIRTLLSDGRRLTTIVHLSHAWEPTMRSMRVKMDVERRLFNRLVLFWSSDRQHCETVEVVAKVCLVAARL